MKECRSRPEIAARAKGYARECNQQPHAKIDNRTRKRRCALKEKLARYRQAADHIERMGGAVEKILEMGEAIRLAHEIAFTMHDLGGELGFMSLVEMMKKKTVLRWVNCAH